MVEKCPHGHNAGFEVQPSVGMTPTLIGSLVD